MSTETELRRRPARALPELDAEDEVDLGRYGTTVAARWWLPLAGLILGIAAGYALALGGKDVYRAEALLYLGQPLSGDQPLVATLQTNPTTVQEIVHSAAALREAGRRSGLRLAQLRGNVSAQAIAPPRGAARPGQGPLYEIAVKGEGAGKVETAADVLATRVVARVSGFVDAKIEAHRLRLEAARRSLASIERRIALQRAAVANSRGLTPLETLALVSQLDNSEQQRAQLIDEQLEAQQRLSLAEHVERAQVVERAAAVKTTARSVRNSALVAGVLGLLLGVLAALAWEPLSARMGRRPVP